MIMRPPASGPGWTRMLVLGALLASMAARPAAARPAGAAESVAAPAPLAADTITITVKNVVLGKTPKFVGATEAGGFWIEDLLDLGLNTYKLWTDMGELEWWDDDDAQTGLWNGVLVGTPPISAIKADAPNGFVNTIPWAWWDQTFTEDRFWRFGTKSRKGILDQLKANGIEMIGMLRTFNSDGYPEWRPNAEWAPRPPVDQAFRNEWWEHCFAMAYWVNVRNDYRITHWQVLNEPNYYKCNDNGVCKGQGWIGSSLAYYAGDEYDYAKLVNDAYDAVKYANDMVGLPTYIHAPQAAAFFSSYVSTALDSADAAIQVVDYHTFADKPTSTVNYVKNTIATHNPDGEIEPIFVSEFGGLGYLGPQYQTLKRAITTGDQVIAFADAGVEGITIYNMYDWLPPINRGIVDMLGDSTHVTGKVYTPTYYAYRLLIRAVEADKDRMKFAKSANLPGHKALVTRDPNALWVLVMNANGPVKVDLSAVPGYGGTATLYEFSATHNDEIVDAVPVSGGVFTFSAPDSSLLLAKLPKMATPTCGGRAVTLLGTPGDDLITGTAGVDVIDGGDGNDTIQGLGSADYICGGPGADTIYGGDGGDKIYAGDGDDVVYGGTGIDVLQGEAGDDSLNGEGANDQLSGGNGTDTCNGGGGTGDTADASCETVTQVP